MAYPARGKLMSRAKILIVDDETAVRTSLRKALAQEGLAIEEASSGEEALQMLSHLSFELVLTDIRMYEVSGLDLLAEIRNQWPDTVVILLTGYASLESAIQALRQGAHDYLIKPASIHEVRASVREGLDKRQEAIHRRDLLARLREGILELSGQTDEESVASLFKEPARASDADPASDWLQVGDLTVDKAKYLVAVAGAPIELTSTEFRLLTCLLDNRGRVVHYRELVEKVHGYECDLFEARQLIMPHVSNLRRKLRVGPDSPDLIKNVRGVGYIFP
jgi:two-component system alkaline phosphatase synthesis response regulator PhoP